MKVEENPNEDNKTLPFSKFHCLPFAVYNFLLYLGFLVLLPRLIFQQNFWKRFGRLPDFTVNGRKVIWVHCVSVGETQAARPLVRLLRQTLPEYKLVISTTTSTGQSLAKKVFAQDADLVFYFPFDFKFSVRKALEKINPEVVILMETEIWFNFIREASRKGVKICIANARLSEKSFRRYSMIRKTIEQILSHIRLILAQSQIDAERFLQLGAEAEKVKMTGNLKFDLDFDEAENELSRVLQERFADENPIILAASTHRPEESWILDAFSLVLKSSPHARLMIAPRHPERFDEVAELVRNKGFDLARRSAKPNQADKTSKVILLDSIGELRSAMKLAEIVFVGGSLIPHGGQNILEAAVARKVIVTGFYTMNFSSIVEEFRANSALIQLPPLKEEEIVRKLKEVFLEFLQNDSLRREMAERAFRLIEANKGATAKTVQALSSLLKKNVA
ncbi:MAG: 3-deoxy-D-manno-octulosonic acid transferase [Acidobacteria bacterium]|jgi:3-deoxy-D-manno-octulosonic-acid transferase|nr:MAG: 3-deoxy-D-manno-octulosonic acid transferase [Acidobacteriota bacterium]GIU81725.1 MAG: 3-deoxy-D-manno-octulosonic acid transferase [Pyrinomonadaceae bacterium]